MGAVGELGIGDDRTLVLLDCDRVAREGWVVLPVREFHEGPEAPVAVRVAVCCRVDVDVELLRIARQRAVRSPVEVLREELEPSERRKPTGRRASLNRKERVAAAGDVEERRVVEREHVVLDRDPEWSGVVARTSARIRVELGERRLDRVHEDVVLHRVDRLSRRRSTGDHHGEFGDAVDDIGNDEDPTGLRVEVDPVTSVSGTVHARWVERGRVRDVVDQVVIDLTSGGRLLGAADVVIEGPAVGGQTLHRIPDVVVARDDVEIAALRRRAAEEAYRKCPRGNRH